MFDWPEGGTDVHPAPRAPGDPSCTDAMAAPPPSGGVPAGTIVMWSGSVATIPTGWTLCDGTAGTPDLRDRFIIAALSGEEGTSGGAVDPDIAITAHPNHVVTQPNAHADVPNHTHPITDPGHVHNELAPTSA